MTGLRPGGAIIALDGAVIALTGIHHIPGRATQRAYTRVHRHTGHPGHPRLEGLLGRATVRQCECLCSYGACVRYLYLWAVLWLDALCYALSFAICNGLRRSIA